MDITINPIFEQALPFYETDDSKKLEKDILDNGIRDAIILWNGQIIDGHRRYDIASRNDLEFTYEDYTDKFESEEEVLIWIKTNQLQRRNLTDLQKQYIRGKLYEVMKESRAEEDDTEDSLRTSERLGAEHGVGEKTIRREAKLSTALDVIADIVGEEIKTDILSGKIKSAYRSDIINIAAKSEDEIIIALDPIKKGKTDDLKASVKMSKTKANYSELKQHEKEFCQKYIDNGFDSLGAYEGAFKVIIKTRASQELAKINRWIYIVDLILQYPKAEGFVGTVQEAHNKFEKSHQMTPFEAYEHFVEVDNHQPRYNTIMILLDLFRFFEVLDRNKFMKEVQNALKFYHSRLVNMAGAKNGVYAADLKRLPKPQLEEAIEREIHLN
jgi:hypothetical protein